MDNGKDLPNHSEGTPLNGDKCMESTILPFEGNIKRSTTGRSNFLIYTDNECVQQTDQLKSKYDTNSSHDTFPVKFVTQKCHKGIEVDQNVAHIKQSSVMPTVEQEKSDKVVNAETYNLLLKRFSQLEKHCISLEIALQQESENFKNNQPSSYSELSDISEYFLINDLKAQLKAKDLIINKLKQHVSCTSLHEPIITCDDCLDKTDLRISELIIENEFLKHQCQNLSTSVETNSCSAVTKKSCSMNPNWPPPSSEPSVLGAPPLYAKLPGKHRVRQLSAFRSERKLQSKSKQSTMLNGKHSLNSSVTSQSSPKDMAHYRSQWQHEKNQTNVIVNRSNQVVPLRQRSEHLHNTRRNHFNVVEHDKFFRNRARLRWIPTGRKFTMKGSKWTQEYDKCSTIIYDSLNIKRSSFCIKKNPTWMSAPYSYSCHTISDAGTSFIEPTKMILAWIPKGTKFPTQGIWKSH